MCTDRDYLNIPPTGPGRWRANALGFLQAFPQNLILNEAPGILHSLDQSAFVVARRWPGLLILDFRILQLRGLAVEQRRKQLRLVALFVGRLPVRECRAPAEIDGLTTGGAEFEASHVKSCGCLPVAEVGHQGGQIGPRDDVEEFFLVERKARPDLPQVVDRVDVGNDGVMARTLQPLVVESAVRAFADDRRIGHGDRAERLAHPQSGHDLWHVRYQALWQVTHLGARIGDDLLALAVVEFLRHRERLARRPAEARAAYFLQRRQIVQFGWPLPLSLDAHAKRALKALSGVDDGLGDLTLEDSLLRRMSPLRKLPAASSRCGMRRRSESSSVRSPRPSSTPLKALRARLACASRLSGKGHPNCTICRRCRKYAARASAGRRARRSRWRRNSTTARARRSSPILAPRCVTCHRA